MKNAFNIEKQRQEFAAKGNLKKLKMLYGRSYPEIINLNNSAFWDERIDSNLDHKPYDGMTRERVDIAYKLLPKTALKILDIGAGYGYIERLLTQNKKIQIYGNDISDNAIKNLTKRFKGNFKKESVYSLRYPVKSFDAVFALEVLEHIPPSKIFKVLKDIKKILKKGGSLIISVPTNEGLDKMKDNPNGHIRMYTKELIVAELKLAEFEVLDVKALYAFNNLYLLKKIISKIIKNKWEPNDIIVKASSI